MVIGYFGDCFHGEHRGKKCNMADEIITLNDTTVEKPVKVCKGSCLLFLKRRHLFEQKTV